MASSAEVMMPETENRENDGSLTGADSGISDHALHTNPANAAGFNNETGSGATVAEQTGNQRGGTRGTTSGKAGSAAARTRATGKPKTGPQQKVLASDRKIMDDPYTDGGPRRNFSTKLFPELADKIKGVVYMSKMTGAPRGFDTEVKVIQEALGRFFATIEEEDGLEIPMPYKEK